MSQANGASASPSPSHRLLLELKHSDIGPFSVSLRLLWLLPSLYFEIIVPRPLGSWHPFRRPLVHSHTLCIHFACAVMMGGALWKRDLSWNLCSLFTHCGSWARSHFPFRNVSPSPQIRDDPSHLSSCGEV